MALRKRGFTTPRALTVGNYSSIGALIYAAKTVGKLAGWVIRSSSDGTTYNSSGDQITTGSSGAGGMNNNNAWFCWRAPAAVEGHRPEYCIQMINVAVGTSSVILKFSPSAGFTGGSPNATTMPTATDQQTLLNSATLFSTLFNQTDHVGAACFDDAAPYGFWIGGMGGGSGVKAAYGIWMHDPMQSGRHTDASPYNCYAKGVVNVMSAANFSDAPGPAWYGAFGTANEAYRGFPAMSLNTSVSGANAVLWPGGVVANQYNTYVDLIPVVYGRSTSVANAGFKGVSSLCCWIGQSDAEPREIVYSTQEETANYIRFGNCALAWDGSTPSGYSVEQANLHFEPDRVAPAIANVSPAAASTIANTDSISFDITDAGGNLQRALIYVAKASGTDMIYNGSAFLDPYDGGSSATPITNGFTYVVEPDVGWDTTSITVHVVCYDDAGNEFVTSTAYTVTYTAPVAADPELDNIDPVEDSTIDADDQIEFDVVDDDDDLALVVVLAESSSGTEVVYDGVSFGPNFQEAPNAISDITNGKHFVIRRDGYGWQGETLDIRVTAIDDLGNLASPSTFSYDVNAVEVGPTIEVISPTEGSALDKTTPIVLEIADLVPISKVFVWVKFANERTTHLVYDSSDFLWGYETGSSLEGTTTEKTLTLVPDQTWLGEIESLRVRVVNTLGVWDVEV